MNTITWQAIPDVILIYTAETLNKCYFRLSIVPSNINITTKADDSTSIKNHSHFVRERNLQFYYESFLNIFSNSWKRRFPSWIEIILYCISQIMLTRKCMVSKRFWNNVNAISTYLACHFKPVLSSICCPPKTSRKC